MSPTNKKKVRAFIGELIYYGAIWTRRPHLLHPWTVITSIKVKFEWIDLEQKLFYATKYAVSHDTVLAYSDLNERSDIHKDARKYQLIAVISQDGKQIIFCTDINWQDRKCSTQ